MESPIKMDDLGVPLFLETPMYSRKVKPTKGPKVYHGSLAMFVLFP